MTKLKIHHPDCGFSYEIDLLCPNCHLPYCSDDTQQVTGGLIAGYIGHDIKITRLQNHLRNILTKSEDYLATITDDVILGDTTTVKVTITLPSVIGNEGKCYTIMKINAGTKELIIQPQPNEKINNNLKETISNRYASRDILCTGAEWVIYSKMT